MTNRLSPANLTARSAAFAHALAGRLPPIPQLLPSRQRRSPLVRHATARPAGLARLITGALAAVALLALFGALALPATAQAQEIVLVSNIAESHSSNVNINAPDLELAGIPLTEKRTAQRFTTGPNTAGYVLQSVVLNLSPNFGSGPVVVNVAIHEDNGSGNPGTLLVVLNNPADPIGDNTGTAGNRTFSAASPLSLEANTRYWVLVSNTGTNSSFNIALTNSNNQTTHTDSASGIRVTKGHPVVGLRIV